MTRSLFLFLTFVLAVPIACGLDSSDLHVAEPNQGPPSIHSTRIYTSSETLFINGTLSVDGENLTYRNILIVQNGNVRVTNGGKLTISNSTLKFQQLAPNQFSIIVEDGSELVIEDSLLESKYAVTWIVSHSQVMLHDSQAWQSSLDVLLGSYVELFGSTATRVNARDSTTVTIDGGSVTAVGLDSNAQGCLSRAQITSLVLASNSHVDVQLCQLSEIVCSGDARVVLQSSGAESVHLWNGAFINASDSALASLELYDSTTCGVVSSDVGRLVVRSLERQQFINLTIRDLECAHYSVVEAHQCTIGSVLVKEHSNVTVSNSTIDTAVITDFSWGLLNTCQLATLTVEMQASCLLVNVNSTSLTCCGWAKMVVVNTRVYHLWVWNFGEGSTSVHNSTLTIMNVWYSTIFGMTGTTVGTGAIYSTAVASVKSCNFTGELHLFQSADVNISDCVIAALFVRDEAKVRLSSTSFCWYIVPDPDPRIVTEAPVGYVGFWNPLTNGTVDDATYNLTATDCCITQVRIRLDQQMTCEVSWSVISGAYMSEQSNIAFNYCEVSEIQAAGYTVIRQCSIGLLSTYSKSSGEVISTNVTSWNVRAQWSAVDSSFGLIVVGYSAHVNLLNCTIETIWLTEQSEVVIFGNLSLSTYYIGPSSRVLRWFDLTMTLENDTSPGPLSYGVLSSSNLTLLSGITSADGTSLFSLGFCFSNSSQFPFQFSVEVSELIFHGSCLFSVTSFQPLLLVVHERNGMLGCLIPALTLPHQEARPADGRNRSVAIGSYVDDESEGPTHMVGPSKFQLWPILGLPEAASVLRCIVLTAIPLAFVPSVRWRRKVV